MFQIKKNIYIFLSCPLHERQVMVMEVRKHINDKHKSLMNDDLNSWYEAELYEGFGEEGHRISQNDNLYK